jgi:hypothetical protein
MDLREIEWDGIDWADVARVEGSCEHGNGPLGYIKY